MSSALKQKAISSIIWSSIGKFGTLGISFISNLILARLLMPSDFGYIGMLAIFLAISQVFITGGLGSALIQKKDATHLDYTTVFYWNLALSLLFVVILFFTAPSIAGFYNMPLLKDILRVQSIILIINSFTIVQSTQLQKELRFKELSIRNIVSSLVGTIVAIVMAYKGCGVWSLVYSTLISATVSVILLWNMSLWKPTFEFSTESMKKLFSFGGYVLSSNLINTFSNNIQSLIIGKVFSIQDVGYFTQARKLEEIPTNSFSSIFGQVAYPVFSKVQNDTDKMRYVLKQITRQTASVVFPIMILLIIIANPLITILYTSKWSVSIPYFQILCIGGIAVSLQNINYYVVAAMGKGSVLFRWTLIKRILGLILLIIGTFFGMNGLLFGMVLGSYVIYFINAYLAGRYINYNIFTQIKDLTGLLVASTVPGVIVYYIGIFLPIANIYLTVVFQSSIYLLLYLFILNVFHKELLSEVTSIIKSYKRRK